MLLQLWADDGDQGGVIRVGERWRCVNHDGHAADARDGCGYVEGVRGRERWGSESVAEDRFKSDDFACRRRMVWCSGRKEEWKGNVG